jgi:beta-alanine degradation protein BauB
MKRLVGAGVIVVAGVAVLGTLWTARGHTEAAPAAGLTVKFENDRVRVLELRLKPGERERQHSHPQYVLYALTDYRVRNTKADGTTQVFERQAGDVFWGEPVTHGGENVGATELRAVIVELKPTHAP